MTTMERPDTKALDPTPALGADIRPGAGARAGYAAFLAAKAQMDGEHGFEPLWMPDFLFGFQQHLVDWAIRKGRAALFADCVAGDTIIQGPDGDERVDVLAARGKPMRVWALDKDGRCVPALATAPWRKGQAALYRFTLASGRAITVTDRHRFLTPFGWIHAANVAVGSLLAVGHSPSCADSPRASSEASCLARWPANDPHCARISSDWPDRYPASRPDHGGQPPLVLGSVLAALPSPGDARAHNPPWWHRDALADRGARSRLRPPCDRPSTLDWLDPASYVGHGAGYHDAASHPRQHPSRLPDGRQCAASASRPPSVAESPPHQPASAGAPSAYPLLDTVVTIEYITTGDYYDLHVPLYENYLANGIWGHNCGLGKGPMALVWAENMYRKSGKPVLILTPLAVGDQMQREAHKFGIDAACSRDGRRPAPLVIANYERLHYFDRADFGAVVCDESSVLKCFDGQTRSAITAFMRHIPYRLLCTATAAPNDYVELGTSSEALGYLGHMDMLGRFFVNEEQTVQGRHGRFLGWTARKQWRFKGHAEEPFWRWVSSWARAMRRPSDLGFSDEGFALPPLVARQHRVAASAPRQGMLFALPAVGLQEERDEARRTVTERCALAADLLADAPSGIAWCQLNAEGDELARRIPGSVQVSGSDALEKKEEALRAFSAGQVRVLVTKPLIAAHGLNWQHCHRMTYMINHSYEQYYQAVRRCWRFGQTQPVTVDVITTEGGENIIKNLERKSRQADEMFSALVTHMSDALHIARGQDGNEEIEVPAWLRS